MSTRVPLRAAVRALCASTPRRPPRAPACHIPCTPPTSDASHCHGTTEQKPCKTSKSSITYCHASTQQNPCSGSTSNASSCYVPAQQNPCSGSTSNASSCYVPEQQNPCSELTVGTISCSGSLVAPPCPVPAPPVPPCRAARPPAPRAVVQVCRPRPPAPPPPCAPPACTFSCGVLPPHDSAPAGPQCGGAQDCVALRKELAARARRHHYESETRARRAGPRPGPPDAPYTLGAEREVARATDGHLYAVRHDCEPAGPCRLVVDAPGAACHVPRGRLAPCAHRPRVFQRVHRAPSRPAPGPPSALCRALSVAERLRARGATRRLH